MNRKALRDMIERTLESVTDEVRSESRYIIEAVLTEDWLSFVLSPQEEVTQAVLDQVNSILERRLKHEPIQYILGEQAFMGLPFRVSPEVLIPRQDTESLVAFILRMEKAWHIKHQGTLKVLDVGTGSGAIAVSLAVLGQKIKVHASDISPGALELARENSLLNHVSEDVVFIESDLFEKINQKYDVIVSNPPYIPLGEGQTLQEEVNGYEPHMALFGGEDGLDFYRQMIPEAKSYLEKGGVLVFEAGHDQARAIEELMRAHAYTSVGRFADLRGVERFIYGYND